MGYRNLQQAVSDLEQHGKLIRIDSAIDPHLEAGAIQRRVYAAGGPALLFTNVTGCAFPLLGNLFGTLERTRFLFRDTLPVIEKMVACKINPAAALKNPLQLPGLGRAALNLLPKKTGSGPILTHSTSVDQLPQLVSWPDDGGAFITLPQVYSESPGGGGFRSSNLGMYRVQLSGNDYIPNQEVGLHYQIHRGIGVHHAEAVETGQPLPVNIFVGGPPSLTVAAVMPLPEGMPELSFAGLLGGHRMPMVTRPGGLPIPAEADFCLVGSIDPAMTKAEGPFGDHLGYYSLAHDFPVVKIEQVWHRPGAIWPFTTVGRPPQEDTSFGAFIHELTGELIPDVLPGVRAVHAVDAAGVHPLLLAIGSERYTPYEQTAEPKELLTQASAILGNGQLSLAKYLMMTDDEQLDIHNIPAFFRHVLERADWRRDLHFTTRTTVDTLDYSGHALNLGSKLTIAAAGPAVRKLPQDLPDALRLPAGFERPRMVAPGIMAINGPKATAARGASDPAIETFCAAIDSADPINDFPLLVIVDDSDFVAADFANFLWAVFTRSNPATDVYGIGASTISKHWGCTGALVIDARIKPHHAPPLIDDPAVEKKVDALGASGQPLHGII
ncbi:MAG: 3-octaprenyl-4-hydroxybenzoate carboxy-lyase [Desulfuromonas sp.]|nr:MAG: 3-octaprenyl-4-hydroxybenzoate carboxy-lyase [Desulfuromonas sp.]